MLHYWFSECVCCFIKPYFHPSIHLYLFERAAYFVIIFCLLFFSAWMWYIQHFYQQVRAGLIPNSVWCCCQKSLFFSWYSRQTKRSNTPHLQWRQVSKAIKNECAWLQKFWGGCILLWCATLTRRQLCTAKKCRKNFLSTPWAYFRTNDWSFNWGRSTSCIL